VNTDVMFSSVTDLWGTPAEFFRQYDEEYHFTLDAAADEHNHKCEDWLGPGGLADDALNVGWSGHRVWLNPAYSQCEAFVEKARYESVNNDVGSVILVPSRTDTKWFHNHIYCASYNCYYPWVKRVRWVKGRLKFTLHVSDEMRAQVMALARFEEADVQEETGLPKTIIRAIRAGRPEVAESAPVPSLVVVLKGDW